MAALSSPRPCGLLSIVGSMFLLFLLRPVGREGLSGVVRAEESEREAEADRESCSETVSSWSDEQLLKLSSLPPERELDHVKIQDLLFFLHVPRTGGRTFHQCFLKHVLPSGQRCRQSYDHLRFNRSHPGCRLISTHDDYSLLENLQLDRTSVVTILRQPLDRVLSTYEFSVEVAARSLGKSPRRKPATGNSAHSMVGPTFMTTLDIWPWRYVVRTMEVDLFARRAARQGVQKTATEVSVDDSYDATEIAMPLHEFVDHPVAHELVHNGATFQVAGLTNTSYSKNAGAIRHCVVRFPPLGKLVVEVAKKRLDRMLYVGLTERQNESVLFFVKVLRDQISLEGFMRSLLDQALRSQSHTSLRDSSKLRSNLSSLDEFTEEELTAEMMASYGRCVGQLRRSQEVRRSRSLKTITPIEFSREQRKLIPDDVMEKISALNLLDAELYEHAQGLFQQQHFDNSERILSNYEPIFFRKYFTVIVKWLSALWVLIALVVLGMVLHLLRRRGGLRVKEF